MRKLAYILLSSLLLISLAQTTQGQEEKKPIRPKLRLSYKKSMDGKVKVNANSYYKVKKKKEFCEGATVGFYTDEDMKNLNSSVQVDENGNATLDITTADLKNFRDSLGRLNFFARLEKDDRFKATSADLTVLDGNIDVTFSDGDPNSVEATVQYFDPDSGKMVPAERVPLKFMVKRALGMMKFGESLNYTDAEGKVSVDFPNDIPGNNAEGEVTIVVKLDEDDDLGTVEFSGKVNWGIPLPEQKSLTKGTLASGEGNAPLSMVIVILGALTGIWLYLFHIIWQLFRINKLGKQP